jgi:hypothetical protein
MPDQELEVKIKADKQKADETARALRDHQKDIQETVKGYRQMEQQARKFREVGTVIAASGVAILAPLVASANEYAKRYGALEKNSRDFLAAQQRSADATASLGRVAAQALTPIMNQVADFQQKVAAFAAAHPELVQAAVGVGGALVAGGGALVAAGTAISAVARSAELLKSSLGGGGAMGGLVGGIAKAGVAVGALALGAKIGEAAVQALGKASGNTRLEAFTLADALKSVRQLIAIAAVAIAQMFIDAKVTLGRIGDILSGVGALIKDKFESTLDTFATGFRIMLESLKDGVGKFINGILDAAATLAVKLNQPQLAEQIMGGINNDAVPDQFGKTQYQHNIDTEVRDLHARQYGRDQALAGHYDPLTGRYTSGAGSQMTTNEAGRQQQYQTDQGNVGKIAAFAGNFANTGSLGPLVDGVLKGIGDKVQSFLGGFNNAPKAGISTNGVAGLPPEAVNAFIEYRKALVTSEKQYNTERLAVIKEGNKKIAEAEQNLTEFQATQAQAESDMQTKGQEQDQVDLEKFIKSEAQIEEKANTDRLRRAHDHEDKLTDFAAARDVAGFVQEMRAYSRQEDEQSKQESLDKKQREAAFADQQKERQAQRKEELANLQRQGREKEQQLREQLQMAKQAKEDELNNLRDKHNRENTLLEQHFAEQLASLGDNVAGLKSIHDAYYAQATADAQAFVNNNKAILAQLYSSSLGTGGAGGGTSTPFPTSSGVLDQLAGLSSIPSFDVGGRIPRDMIIKAHKDELILNPHRGQFPGGTTVIIQNLNVGRLATPDDIERGKVETVRVIRQAMQPGGAG